MGNQTAVAIERVALAADIDQARLGAERERLRSAMLTSVSHDLRTPLASIIGALSSLRSYRDRYDDATRDELLGTALSEAERLDRFVGNLLDMTRLDAGVIVPKREAVEVGDLDLDHAAPGRAGAEGPGRRLDRGARPADPVARLRAGRAGAVQHPRQRREIFGRRAAASRSTARAQPSGRVEIVVRDEGPGIDPAALDRLFDKFYRADDGDRRRAGTGLGLAIAKGFVEVQGGTIAARNRGDRSGAEFVVSYPRHDRQTLPSS